MTAAWSWTLKVVVILKIATLQSPQALSCKYNLEAYTVADGMRR